MPIKGGVLINTYLILKLVHIVSSTLLFGTGLGTAYYLWRAHRTGDVAVIAAVSRSVVWADWLFTTPAVVIQPVTGFWMMALAGVSVGQTWVWLSLVLYVVAAGCWLPVVWLQFRLRNLSREAMLSGRPLPADYSRTMRIWLLLGWPAFLSVLAIFVLMVIRPG